MSRIEAMLVIGMLLSGCKTGESTRPETPPPPVAVESAVPIPETHPALAKVTPDVVDPVCEAVIVNPVGSPRELYEGKLYYFCSEECEEAFKNTPYAFESRHGVPPQPPVE